MNIIEQLKRDEGVILSAYEDSLGYLTIGCGRLIDKRKSGGISQEEADFLLQNDIKRTTDALLRALPWVANLDEVRRSVLINMGFNMGVPGLLNFKNTLGLIQAGKWEDAAKAMLQSKWASQVGDRASRLSKQMETGEWV